MTEEKKIIKAIKKAMPSVVSIISDFTFKKKEKILDIFRSEKTEEKIKLIGGSGFAVGKNLVLTSLHVIEKKENYYILDYERKRSMAEIIYTDKASDIAFLKIKSNFLKPIRIGNSDNLEIGQTVIAIGTALGLFPNTVSKGIVSGVSRTIVAQGENDEDKELYGLIQTDAAINPGNSGGPLINLKGEVIGINTATVFGVENIGFALPINIVKEEIEDILAKGYFKKTKLGIQYIILDRKINKLLSLPASEGALIVKEPSSESLAFKAGLRKDDIILEINNKKINSRQTIKKIISKNNLKSLIFKILRGGVIRILSLEIK